ncbi:unnamed protein product [Cylicocyclus nassatus]|uniref:Fatty-acid and retinol-binding protein 1 n=1 Tax=Cylicocyclus nassatus TaxID=53992 RepID=A0AA36M4G9_CYLNA|nr:unnamed protein product [Cylicocyclus nassatus]
MIRSFVVIIPLLSLSVLTFKYNDIPEQYRELLPPEAKEFLSGLTDEDKAALKEVFKSSKEYANDEEFVAEVTKKSADLGAKVKKLTDLMKKKVDALKPEAQAFAKDLIERARKIRNRYFADDQPKKSILKEAGLETIKKYKELSDEAKEDFKKEFPALTAVLTSDKTLKRLETLN